MKITSANFILCSPGPNFVTLKIETDQVRTACHGAMDIGPAAMAANLHIGLWAPNSGIQEYSGYTEATHTVFPHAFSQTGGFMHLGEAPGLGVDIVEKLAAQYPYERAYLPVNRSEVGTMWSW